MLHLLLHSRGEGVERSDMQGLVIQHTQHTFGEGVEAFNLLLLLHTSGEGVDRFIQQGLVLRSWGAKCCSRPRVPATYIEATTAIAREHI